MSGLCGWFSREPAALPLADMAAPFGTAAPLRQGSHSLGAAALAAGADDAAFYHEDGLLIVHWGERVEELARLWRTHGAQACAALSGHFCFAILDERRAEALLAVDRCATRPLFYQLVGRSLLFASSLEALARHPGAAPTRCWRTGRRRCSSPASWNWSIPTPPRPRRNRHGGWHRRAVR